MRQRGAVLHGAADARREKERRGRRCSQGTWRLRRRIGSLQPPSQRVQIGAQDLFGLDRAEGIEPTSLSVVSTVVVTPGGRRVSGAVGGVEIGAEHPFELAKHLLEPARILLGSSGLQVLRQPG